MTVLTPERAPPDAPSSPTTITVGHAGLDTATARRLESALGDCDAFEIVSVDPQSPTTGRFDVVDCVVTAFEGPSWDGADFRETVRSVDERLPVVFVTPEPPGALPDWVHAAEWTDCLQVGTLDAVGVLAGRIRSLVATRRAAGAADNLRGALDAIGVEVALLDRNGAVEFANAAFGQRLGYDDATLRGQPWQSLYTDPTVEHLESTVLPTLPEAWRWTGECVARHSNGDAIAVTARIVTLEDGGLAVCHGALVE